MTLAADSIHGKWVRIPTEGGTWGWWIFVGKVTHLSNSSNNPTSERRGNPVISWYYIYTVYTYKANDYRYTNNILNHQLICIARLIMSRTIYLIHIYIYISVIPCNIGFFQPPLLDGQLPPWHLPVCAADAGVGQVKAPPNAGRHSFWLFLSSTRFITLW